VADPVPGLVRLWLYLAAAALLAPVALAVRAVCALKGHWPRYPGGRVCVRCTDWLPPREGAP
jgi:hypothetical protein